MRKVLLSYFLCLMIIIVSGCISIPTEDGGTVKISKDGLKINTADGEEVLVSLDKDNDSLTIKGTDADGEEGVLNIDMNEGGMSWTGIDGEGLEFEMNAGFTNEIPDGFPKDIPIPEDAIIFMALTSETIEGTAYTVQYFAEGKVIDYYDLYRKYVDGLNYDEIDDLHEGKADHDFHIENLFVYLSDGNTLDIMIMDSNAGFFGDNEISVKMSYTINN